MIESYWNYLVNLPVEYQILFGVVGAIIAVSIIKFFGKMILMAGMTAAFLFAAIWYFQIL